MVDYTEVEDKEGRALAKELGAIFQLTSAKNDPNSIDRLFQNIGKKILNPSSVTESNLSKAELKKLKEKEKRDTIKNLNKQGNNNNKGGCCGNKKA